MNEVPPGFEDLMIERLIEDSKRNRVKHAIEEVEETDALIKRRWEVLLNGCTLIKEAHALLDGSQTAYDAKDYRKCDEMIRAAWRKKQQAFAKTSAIVINEMIAVEDNEASLRGVFLASSYQHALLRKDVENFRSLLDDLEKHEALSVALSL